MLSSLDLICVGGGLKLESLLAATFLNVLNSSYFTKYFYELLANIIDIIMSFIR